MYKNQLQELAQRSCFNLPSYTSIREGPDHAPRFKAIVNFNGETFDSPHYCSTLRQAEHAAAEVALNSLSTCGPSQSLAARILDETGVYKNLLQEIAQRVGAPLPQYRTFRSGMGYQPVFTGIVELADIMFHGEPAKNKKQAEKSAALAAWSSLKQLAKQDATVSSESENCDEQEQIRIARALLNYRLKEKMGTTSSTSAPVPFQKKFPVLYPRATSPHPPSSATTSRILSLIGQKTIPQNRSASLKSVECHSQQLQRQLPEVHSSHSQIFPSAGAAPYVPYRQFRTPYHGIAQPVIMRTAVPAYASPPLPPPLVHPHHMIQSRSIQIAPPVHVRQSVVAFSAPPVQKDPQIVAAPALPNNSKSCVEELGSVRENRLEESNVMKDLERLEI